MAQKPIHIKITPQSASSAAEDFSALRAMGLDRIIELSSQYWTDYNEHDPGITLLEALAYAVTDLGYRTHFPLEDILAQAEAKIAQSQFHTARPVLSTAPVTLTDFRKQLTDLPDVTNAWLIPVKGLAPVKGQYRILIQADEVREAEAQATLIEAVKQRFADQRNLGEDFAEVQLATVRPIALALNLVVEDGFQAEDVLAKALAAIDLFLRGALEFESLPEAIEKTGGRMDQVFEGPALQHGFVPEAKLPPKAIRVSAQSLIPLVQKVAGVLMVQRLELRSISVSEPTPERVENLPDHRPEGFLQSVSLGSREVPALGPLNQCLFQVNVAGIAADIDSEELQHQLETEQLLGGKAKQVALDRDLPVPKGKKRDLDHYYSVQYDLPALYKLRPGAISPHEDEERVGAAHQLRGFLSIFDQLMINYLGQLANLGKLFSWDASIQKTWFFQGLERALHEVENVLTTAHNRSPLNTNGKASRNLQAGLQAYHAELNKTSESQEDFLTRRNHFLDHVLARLGWSLGQWANSIEQHEGNRLVRGKESFLATYPALSANRSKGGNYLSTVYTPENVAGLRRLVEGMLGMSPETYQHHRLNQRFSLLSWDPTAKDHMGLFDVYNLQGTSLNVPFLMQIGRDPAHYRVVTASNKEYTFQIWDPERSTTEQEVFMTSRTFTTEEACRAAGAELANLIADYNQTSERIHLLDHVLLRPGPQQASFGLQLLKEDGKPLLETNAWYTQAALANITALTGGPQANYEIQYNQAPLHVPVGNFTFLISATHNGTPFPVTPRQGVSLPGDIPENSPVFLRNESGKLFKAYLQKHYPHELHQAEKIGAALLLDFMQTDLPEDWQTADKGTDMMGWGQYVMRVLLETVYPATSTPASQLWEDYCQWTAGIGGEANLNAQLLFAWVEIQLSDPTVGSFLRGVKSWSSDSPFLADFDSQILPRFKDQYLSPTQQAGLDSQIEQIQKSNPSPAQLKQLLIEALLSAYTAANPAVINGLSQQLLDLLNPGGSQPSGAAGAYLAALGRNMGKGFLKQFFQPALTLPAQLGAEVLLDFDLEPFPLSLEPALNAFLLDEFKRFAYGVIGRVGHLTGENLKNLLLHPDQHAPGAMSALLAPLAQSGRRFLGMFLQGLFGVAQPPPIDIGLYVSVRLTGATSPQPQPQTLSQIGEEGLLAYCQTQLANQQQDLLGLGTALSGTFLQAPVPTLGVPQQNQLGNLMAQVFSWYLNQVLLVENQPELDDLKALLGIKPGVEPEPLTILGREALEFFIKEGFVPGPVHPEDLYNLLEQVFVSEEGLPRGETTEISLAASGAFLLMEFLQKYFPAPSQGDRFENSLKTLVEYFIYGLRPDPSRAVSSRLSPTAKDTSGKQQTDASGKKKGKKGKKDTSSATSTSSTSRLSTASATSNPIAAPTEFEKWAQALAALPPPPPPPTPAQTGHGTRSLPPATPPSPPIPHAKWITHAVLSSWIRSGGREEIIFQGDQLSMSDFGWLGAQALAMYLQATYPNLLAQPKALKTKILADIMTPHALSQNEGALISHLGLAGFYLLFQVYQYKFGGDSHLSKEIIGRKIAVWIDYQFPIASPVVSPETGPSPPAAVSQVQSSTQPQYHLSLLYAAGGGPVKLISPEAYPHQSTLMTAIHNLVAQSTAVQQGKLPDDHLYQWKIKSPHAAYSGPKDPYSFQVSAFLPDWPTRFQDPAFQKWIEHTLQLQAPAHLQPNIYWLNHKEMQDFETLLRIWKNANPKSATGYAAASMLASWIAGLSTPPLNP